MTTKHIILTTALASTTTLLACGEDSPEADMELNAAEDAVPKTPGDAPGGTKTLPFATVEVSEGHRLRFFVLPDGGVAVEESGEAYDIQPILDRELSPLELYWRWTTEAREIPAELLNNYEEYVGELDEFFNSAVPRGADRIAAADELTAPSAPPQESKWWPDDCPAPTDFNFIYCLDRHVSSYAPRTQFIRIDGALSYLIFRDTADTDRDVKLYYRNTVGAPCTWSDYFQIDTGQWALYYYTGSSNWSWRATIAGGCVGSCPEFRSIFQYDATQSSTCLP